MSDTRTDHLNTKGETPVPGSNGTAGKPVHAEALPASTEPTFGDGGIHEHGNPTGIETSDQEAARKLFTNIKSAFNEYRDSVSQKGRRVLRNTILGASAVALVLGGAMLGKAGAGRSTPQESRNPNEPAEAVPDTIDVPLENGETAAANSEPTTQEGAANNTSEVMMESVPGGLPGEVTPVELPPEFTEKSLEAERAIYNMLQIAQNPEGVSPEDLSKISTPFWRGPATFDVTLPDLIINDLVVAEGETLKAQMDNPLELYFDGKIYWAAYHRPRGQLITLYVGEKLEGQRVYNQFAYNNEGSSTLPWSFKDDPFSGKFSNGRPLFYDQNGLEIRDNYASTLRSETNAYPEIRFYDDPGAVLSDATTTLGRMMDFTSAEDLEFITSEEQIMSDRNKTLQGGNNS